MQWFEVQGNCVRIGIFRRQRSLGTFERNLLSAGIPHCRLNWRIILSASGAQ